MTHPAAIKQRAQHMRRNGMSILHIARTLNIAKSTTSLWVSPIALPKEIRNRLTDNSETGAARGRQIMKARRDLIAIENIREAKKNIKMVIPQERDKHFWQFCAALIFWCEGSKRHLSGGVALVNSDPYLITFFLHALRSGFELDERRFSALIHLHEYHNEKHQLAFWSRIAKIPLSQFTRSYRKPHTKKRKRENYPGCVSVRYGDARLARKLDALYHIIGQYMRA